MNPPQDHHDEPPILPDRSVPADWQSFVTEFLCGNMNTNQIGALKEKIGEDPRFQAYVSGLAATEARLATLLAESRYKQAAPKEPPAWAMEQLRGAVAQIGRSGSAPQGAWARILGWIQRLTGSGAKANGEVIHEAPDLIGAAMPRGDDHHPALRSERRSWLPLPRLVLAGSSVALLVVMLVVLPRLGKQSSDLAAGSPGVKELLSISPEVFVASVGSPNVVRSGGRNLYSPTGLTSQADPIVVLSPNTNLREVKIEISAPGQPDWAPLQGEFRGSPEPLSKILQKDPCLLAGGVYQIRVMAQGQIVSEETFRITEEPSPRLPQSPSEVLLAALEAVNDVPPRPGDALGFLALLEEKHQKDQAVIRLRYKALIQIGDDLEASRFRNQIR